VSNTVKARESRKHRPSDKAYEFKGSSGLIGSLILRLWGITATQLMLCNRRLLVPVCEGLSPGVH
jgi:hypothetical protein